MRMIHSSSSSLGRALSAGKAPTMPALHCAITSSGTETMKSGAPITGSDSLPCIRRGIGIRILLLGRGAEARSYRRRGRSGTGVRGIYWRHNRTEQAMDQTASAAAVLIARCCIVGGGPAGMMLGFLLARAGVDTVVLEKHGDFLRDFRGDTIHPSTLEVMHELGLLEDLLKLPHQKAPRLNAQVGGLALTVADFTHLPTRCGFIAFMPQWDFLDFLAERGARYLTFKLRMRAEV